MKGLFFTVTRKVAAGYLVIVLFNLLAVGYALTSLRDHTRLTEQLVGIEYRAFSLLRDIRQNLLAQERLEKQLLILRDPQLLELLSLRADDLERILDTLDESPYPQVLIGLPAAILEYQAKSRQLQQVMTGADWDAAAETARKLTVPLRDQLFEQLADLRVRQQAAVDQDLHLLSSRSSKAYHLTLLLTFLGIVLSAPVAFTVIFSIHRSVKALKKATREIAAGSFDYQLELKGRDEFGQLARDFSHMGRKLLELEQLRLDANPLTRLPGNLAIDQELERRIEQRQDFAHLYIDLDNFKVYGDRYGYKAGSDVISCVGELIQEVVERYGGEDDLVGHIGGDDYVVLTDADPAESMAKELIREFDSKIPEFYTEADRQAGCFVGKDRYGVEREFPLLTISVAIVLSPNLDHPSTLAISNACARMKEHLKGLNGSNYLIDRRKQL